MRSIIQYGNHPIALQKAITPKPTNKGAKLVLFHMAIGNRKAKHSRVDMKIPAANSVIPQASANCPGRFVRLMSGSSSAKTGMIKLL